MVAGNSKGELVENSDWEGPCLKNPAKDATSAAVATGSGGGGGVKGARKSMPSGSSRGGGPVGVPGEEAALDNIPTDMSDTTDSEEDKNLESV